MAFNATSCALYGGHSVCFTSKDTPIYYTPNPSYIPGISDRYLSACSHIVAYWILSLFFHFLDSRSWKWLEKYRIHESAEIKSRNLVTVPEVVRAVLQQQFIMVLLGLWWIDESHGPVNHLRSMQDWARTLAPYVQRLTSEVEPQLLHRLAYFVYWWAIPGAQLVGGMFLVDTWQYFLHRAMHMNKWLYRHWHSVHHRLYVPYAFGALYNHPIEGFLLDSVGSVVAETFMRMNARQAALLFTISSLKTVDDHCGYRLPFDPLQLMSGNNADYHDIHHQIQGIKSNFAQPFFIHWDTILGTRMTRAELEARQTKSKKA